MSLPYKSFPKPFTHSLRPCKSSTVLVAASGSGQVGHGKKQRIVFLGTPEVAAGVLKDLLTASQQPESLFEVACVVSQPGKPRGRGNRAVAQPSPVEALARDSGLLAPEQILCPARAREEPFLARLAELQPDLAVTAAYGNMLPQRFLDLPPYGTLNIHPSLLPQYRGAAPVQRALQDGVSETGVSVAYTVLACDAGPVLAQQRVAVDPDAQAPELLDQLFRLGSGLLLGRLADVFAGRGAELAVPQDESQVVHAAKLTREESLLDFRSAPALQLHNTVRAFAGWPGTSGSFLLRDEASGATEPLEVKIVRTRSPAAHHPPPPALSADQPPLQSGPAGPHAAGGDGREREVVFSHDAMLVPCAGGSVLEVLQVQPPTKKAMSARDFKNGLRGKRLLVPA